MCIRVVYHLDRIECTETEKEPKLIKHEKALKLVCNISKDTNHLAEGVQLVRYSVKKWTCGMMPIGFDRFD